MIGIVILLFKGAQAVRHSGEWRTKTVPKSHTQSQQGQRPWSIEPRRVQFRALKKEARLRVPVDKVEERGQWMSPFCTARHAGSDRELLKFRRGYR